jgi:hypothetical protein
VPELLLSLGAITFGVLMYLRTPPWAYLRGRTADRHRWERLYAPTDLPVVMETLDLVCASFLLRSEDRYRLQPSDRLLDIYQASYPKRGADTLEFESLARDLTTHYQLSEHFVVKRLSEATVGTVIHWCLDARRPAA